MYSNPNTWVRRQEQMELWVAMKRWGNPRGVKSNLQSAAEGFTMDPWWVGKTEKLWNCWKCERKRKKTTEEWRFPFWTLSSSLICLAVHSLCCVFSILICYYFYFFFTLENFVYTMKYDHIVSIPAQTSLNLYLSKLIHSYRDEGPSIHQSMRILRLVTSSYNPRWLANDYLTSLAS